MCDAPGPERPGEGQRRKRSNRSLFSSSLRQRRREGREGGRNSPEGRKGGRDDCSVGENLHIKRKKTAPRRFVKRTNCKAFTGSIDAEIAHRERHEGNQKMRFKPLEEKEKKDSRREERPSIGAISTSFLRGRSRLIASAYSLPVTSRESKKKGGRRRQWGSEKGETTEQKERFQDKRTKKDVLIEHGRKGGLTIRNGTGRCDLFTAAQ